MFRWFRCLSACLALLITPSLGELVENLEHLVANGHIAHPAGESDHAPVDAEHGCSGPYHACVCHGSTPFVVSRVPLVQPAPETVVPSVTWTLRDGPADAHAPDLFRPPRA